MIYPDWEPTVVPPGIDPHQPVIVTGDTTPDRTVLLFWQHDPTTGRITLLNRLQLAGQPRHRFTTPFEE